MASRPGELIAATIAAASAPLLAVADALLRVRRADETAAFLPGATVYGTAARGDCCGSWHTST